MLYSLTYTRLVTQIGPHRFHDPRLFACKCKNAGCVVDSFLREVRRIAERDSWQE